MDNRPVQIVVNVGPNAPEKVRRAVEQLAMALRGQPAAATMTNKVMSVRDIRNWLVESKRLSASTAPGAARFIIALLMYYPGNVPLVCAGRGHHYGECRCPELRNMYDLSAWHYDTHNSGWLVVLGELALCDPGLIGKVSLQYRGHITALIAHARTETG